MELPVNKNTGHIAVLLIVAFILIAFIRLNYPLYKNSADINVITSGRAKCDIFTGEWVPDLNAPYYTNRTCWAIHEHQNCMKYGRPDTRFLNWRWKPDGCDMLVLDPFRFLDMVRGKSLAFVGDSVGRNQMQSLICLLSRVEYPVDISPTRDEQFKRWKYANYNFTLAYYWTPFLVQSNQRDPDGPTHDGIFNVYLDEPDPSWATQIDEFHYIILNAGHWFTRAAVYHINRRIVGCRRCQLPNITDLPLTFAYRRVFSTAFRAINGRKNFKGVTFLRTYAPSHFEGGDWNEGGNCLRRRPYGGDEVIMEGSNLDRYMAQLEEFRAAVGEGKKEFRLMDITWAMLMRPDGHPSSYGHWPNANVTLYNDCVHWCLPGPIDAWNDILAHMIEMETRRT